MPLEFSGFGPGKPLVLIAGPCVIESEEHVHRMAHGIREAVGDFVFKASFDKANRTSAGAYRGPGLSEGLRILNMDTKAVTKLTDGYDNVSPTDQEDLIRRANDAEVTVYSITLPSYLPGAGSNKRMMTLLDVSRIVPNTGGADFSADVADFTPVFKAIAEEIRSSYTLSYYPPDKSRRDGRMHQIRVECRKSGAIIRTSRTSYQAAVK